MDCLLSINQVDAIKAVIKRQKRLVKSTDEVTNYIDKEFDAYIDAALDGGMDYKQIINNIFRNDSGKGFVGINLESLHRAYAQGYRAAVPLRELDAKILKGMKEDTAIHHGIKMGLLRKLLDGQDITDPLTKRVYASAESVATTRVDTGINTPLERELTNKLFADFDTTKYLDDMPAGDHKTDMKSMYYSKTEVLETYDILKALDDNQLDAAISKYSTSSIKGSLEMYIDDVSLDLAANQLFKTTNIKDVVELMEYKVLEKVVKRDITGVDKGPLYDSKLVAVATKTIYSADQTTPAKVINGFGNIASASLLGMSGVSNAVGDLSASVSGSIMNGNFRTLLSSYGDSLNGLSKAELEALLIFTDEFAITSSRLMRDSMGEASGATERAMLATLQLSGTLHITNATKRGAMHSSFKTMEKELAEVLAGKPLSETAMLKRAFTEETLPKRPYNQIDAHAEQMLFNAAVHREADLLVATPGWKQTANMYSDSGTGYAAVHNKSFQFLAPVVKSLDNIATQWNRANNIERVTLLTAHVTSITVLGTMGLMVKDLMKGRSPRDLDDPELYLNAMAMGSVGSAYALFTQFVAVDQYGTGLASMDALGKFVRGTKGVGSKILDGEVSGKDFMQLGKSTVGSFVPDFPFTAIPNDIVGHGLDRMIDPKSTKAKDRRYDKLLKKKGQEDLIRDFKR